MKTLVTGADGLLGSAIREAVGDNEDFIFIRRHHTFDELMNDRKVEYMFGAYRPDCVIHTAAKVGGIKINSEHPEQMFYENVVMNTNMIHHAAKSGVKKFIAFGSTCAYEPTLTDIQEKDVMAGCPYVKNQSYGYAKRMILTHLEAAKAEYGMDYTYIIPVSMFGENDNFSLTNGHVIPSLIHKCHIQEELSVWGTGAPKRQVIYSKDMARIVLEFVNKKCERVVVGGKDELSVKQMVETIAKYMDFKGEVIWETDKPDGQVNRPLAKTYNFEFTPFEQAIKQTCDWFKENYPNVRK